MKILFFIILYVLVCHLLHWLALKRKGSLELLAETGDQVATYFIPGFNGPGSNVFRKYSSVVPGDVWLYHHSHFGFDPVEAGNFIATHAKQHGYREVHLYAISVGAKVARHVKLKPVRVWLISPALEPIQLRPGWHAIIKFIAPILWVVKLLLGFLADIPVIMGHSLAEEAGQLISLGYETTALPDQTAGIILSRDDQFLNNGAIQFHYHDTPNVVADTTHANLVRDDIYITAGTKIGAF